MDGQRLSNIVAYNINTTFNRIIVVTKNKNILRFFEKIRTLSLSKNLLALIKTNRVLSIQFVLRMAMKDTYNISTYHKTM